MNDRAAKPVTVTLGGMAKSAQAHVASGRYASISEVVRAGLRALDREEELWREMVRARVATTLGQPETIVPIEDAYAKLRDHAELRREAADGLKAAG